MDILETVNTTTVLNNEVFASLAIQVPVRKQLILAVQCVWEGVK